MKRNRAGKYKRLLTPYLIYCQDFQHSSTLIARVFCKAVLVHIFLFFNFKYQIINLLFHIAAA